MSPRSALAVLVSLTLLLSAAASHALARRLHLARTPLEQGALGRSGGPVDLAISGSSLTYAAVDWEGLAAQRDWRVVTYAAASASPCEIEGMRFARTSANVRVLGTSLYELNEANISDARGAAVPLAQTCRDLAASHLDWKQSKRILGQYPLTAVRWIFPTAGFPRRSWWACVAKPPLCSTEAARPPHPSQCGRAAPRHSARRRSPPPALARPVIFTSFEFCLFFLAVLLLRACCRSFSAEKWVLLAASYAFYASWHWPSAGLLLAVSLTDYALGRAMGATAGARPRRWLLATSLLLNLGLLAFFKYSNFFLETLGAGAGWLGSGWRPPHLDLLLPLGISFFTFQSMSYTIDVYRRHLAPCRSLRDFLLFVSFFPQLVADPIVLAALAHLPVHLAARLPLHSARRQPARFRTHLRQSDAHHAPRRTVARGGLELPHLGAAPRRRTRRASRLVALASGRATALLARANPRPRRDAERGFARLDFLSGHRLAAARTFLQRLLSWETSGVHSISPQTLAALAAVVFVHLLISKDADCSQQIVQRPLLARACAYTGLLTLIVTLAASNAAPFIYFQF